MENIDFDRLVEIVDEFVAPFGLDSDYDADFYYDSEETRVYFSIVISERSVRLFKEYIKNTFNFDAPNIFMISLLHEIGHAETLDTVSTKQLKADHKAKEALTQALDAMSNDDPNYDKVFSTYFDLTIEKIATQWAVDYYKANRKKCDDFYSIFLNALQKEFKRIDLH